MKIRTKSEAHAMTAGIGGKIRELRKKKRLNQDDVATLSGLSVATIKNYESGRSKPNLNNLRAIANVFTVSIDELMSQEESTSTNEKKIDTKLEAVRELEDEDKKTVLSVIDAMILKTQAKKLFHTENKQNSPTGD